MQPLDRVVRPGVLSILRHCYLERVACLLLSWVAMTLFAQITASLLTLCVALPRLAQAGEHQRVLRNGNTVKLTRGGDDRKTTTLIEVIDAKGKVRRSREKYATPEHRFFVKDTTHYANGVAVIVMRDRAGNVFVAAQRPEDRGVTTGQITVDKWGQVWTITHPTEWR